MDPVTLIATELAAGAQGVQVGDCARKDNVFHARPSGLGPRETCRDGQPEARGSR